MGVFSEMGDCDVMGKSKGSVKGVLTCYKNRMIGVLVQEKGLGGLSQGRFHRCAKNASTRPSVTESTRANPTRSNWTTRSTSPATSGSQNPSTSPSCV
jgi:hypothetical protein